MITIPLVKKSTDDTGLTSCNGYIYLVYKVDGKTRRKSLRTDHWPTARRKRSAAFRKMLEDGATVSFSRAPRDKVAADPTGDLYIHQRKPFVFRLGDHTLGEADTLAEAIQLRNKHFEL